MNKHMGHLAHLKTMAETRSISGENDLRLKNYAERNQVMFCGLKNTLIQFIKKFFMEVFLNFLFSFSGFFYVLNF